MKFRKRSKAKKKTKEKAERWMMDTILLELRDLREQDKMSREAKRLSDKRKADYIQ